MAVEEPHTTIASFSPRAAYLLEVATNTAVIYPENSMALELAGCPPRICLLYTSSGRLVVGASVRELDGFEKLRA
jgi:hypothetical protein